MTKNPQHQNNISDEDMVANSTNKYVVKLESTAQGYNDHLKENQYDTNKYFVRTITFAYGSKAEFESVYLARAYAVLEDDTYVYEVPFENYAIQQEVPEHFKNHLQAHGSQIRYIIPSDLESVDSEGNTVTYDYFDRGERKQLTAEEYKQEYEKNISENIEASLEELSKQLGIGNEFLSRKDRNIALSKVLIDEIYNSPRYGVELAAACAVNEETGEFNIPLGDPIQSKRVEQLINSVIKNRVNKQEIAGGPVVQVTNFGTSKELNIRFNSKNGGLLMTKAEFAKTCSQPFRLAP